MRTVTRPVRGRWIALWVAVLLLTLMGLHRPALSLARACRHEVLWRACSGGSDMGVRVLLLLGADPEGRLDARDHDYWFYPSAAGIPTGEALRNRHSHVLKLLLESGANPDAEPSPPDDENLLSMAVVLGDEECVARLVEAGARGQTPSGKSILEIARRRGLSNIVSMLSREDGGKPP